MASGSEVESPADCNKNTSKKQEDVLVKSNNQPPGLNGMFYFILLSFLLSLFLCLILLAVPIIPLRCQQIVCARLPLSATTGGSVGDGTIVDDTSHMVRSFWL